MEYQQLKKKNKKLYIYKIYCKVDNNLFDFFLIYLQYIEFKFNINKY